MDMILGDDDGRRAVTKEGERNLKSCHDISTLIAEQRQIGPYAQIGLGRHPREQIVSNQTLMRSASKKGNPSMRVWVILAARWRDRQLAAGGGCAPPPLPHLIPSLVVGERFRVDTTRCTLSVIIYHTFMISSTQFSCENSSQLLSLVQNVPNNTIIQCWSKYE